MSTNHYENDGHGTVLDHDQPAAVMDHELDISKADDSEGKDAGRASAARRKKMLLIPIAAAIALVSTYFVWNAFRYEDTDDAPDFHSLAVADFICP